MSILRTPATIHRLLFDVLQILSDPENHKPFEVGCRSKTPEDQDTIYRVLKLVFASVEDVVVEMKPEDYIVCVKRFEVVEPSLCF